MNFGEIVKMGESGLTLKIELHTQADVFESLQHEWNSIQTAKPQIFLTWEWQITWWQAYHPGELWVLTFRDVENRLIGIAPWFITPERVLHTIGTEDVSDYLDLILQADCEADILQALACYLQENLQAFTALSLSNIPEASPTLAHFPTALEAQGFQVDVTQQEVCPIIELPETWEGYLESLDKKNRHEMRRKILRADEAFVDWYIVGAEHNIDAELERFIALMRTASRNKIEFLNNPQHVEFFTRMVPLFYEKGWLQLAFIMVGDQPAASYLNFTYNDEVLVYNSGLNIEVGGGFSAGIVLVAHLIRHAIEQGYKRFDLLRGDEEYKYRLGAHDTAIFKLTAQVTEK
jgi:CelD/BcsL family acetyltransferase involved in cellulose biosynthesis